MFGFHEKNILVVECDENATWRRRAAVRGGQAVECGQCRCNEGWVGPGAEQECGRDEDSDNIIIIIIIMII